MIVVAKLRRTHHLSLQVFLVTVKSVIYSNEGYSVFGNLCKKAGGDNIICTSVRRAPGNVTSGPPSSPRSMDWGNLAMWAGVLVILWFAYQTHVEQQVRPHRAACGVALPQHTPPAVAHCPQRPALWSPCSRWPGAAAALVARR